MREIVLDTETTGIDPQSGDRVVEIACVELVNKLPTGEYWRECLNPERDMPEAAFRVHGLSEEFLSTCPLFKDKVDSFLEFIGEDAPLVIHNAEFDLGFLDMELARLGKPSIRNRKIIDTLAIARRKFPGASNSLDGLCQRFNVDLSGRELHGALIDCQLLGAVYLELSGGRQHQLDWQDDSQKQGGPDQDQQADPFTMLVNDIALRKIRPARELGRASKAELELHQKQMTQLPNHIWQNNADDKQVSQKAAQASQDKPQDPPTGKATKDEPLES